MYLKKISFCLDTWCHDIGMICRFVCCSHSLSITIFHVQLYTIQTKKLFIKHLSGILEYSSQSPLKYSHAQSCTMKPKEYFIKHVIGMKLKQ